MKLKYKQLEEFFLPEELEKRKQLEEEMEHTLDRMLYLRNQPQDSFARIEPESLIAELRGLATKYNSLDRMLAHLYDVPRDRFTAQFNGSVSAVLDAAEEYLDNFTPEGVLDGKGADRDKTRPESFLKVARRTLYQANEYLNAEAKLSGNSNCPAMAELVCRKLMQWGYTPPADFGGLLDDLSHSRNYMKAYHPREFSNLGRLRFSDGKTDLLGAVTVEDGPIEYRWDAPAIAKVRGGLSVNTDKLFIAATHALTKANSDGLKPGEPIQLKVQLKTWDYAAMLGFPIKERPTATPEEADKERKRLQNAKKDALKAIRQDAALLLSCKITGKGRKGKGLEEFSGINFFQAVTVKSDWITILFSDPMGKFLVGQALTQYPEELFRLDGRRSSAYNIGKKICEHYLIPANHVNGTANRLAVGTLLEAGGLDAAYRAEHWERAQKETLENVLDTITGPDGVVDILKDWRYVLPGGIYLQEPIESREQFMELLVEFQLSNPPDIQQQIDHAGERKRLRAAAEKKAEKRAVEQSVKVPGKRGRPRKSQ